MMPARTLLIRAAWVLFGAAVVVLVAGSWWASSLYRSEQADSAQASAALGDVRARFSGLTPAFEIRDTRLVRLREPAVNAPASAPAATHLLIWQPPERMLTRVTLPLWLSLVATEPLPLEALAGIGTHGLRGMLEARRRGNELNIRIADLERFGRTLLLDGVTADGKHVLIWND